MASQGTSTLSERVAHHLRVARDQSGMTQRQLAARLGVDQLAVSRWERGVVRPNDTNLAGLADIFGLPMEAFYGPVEEAA